uniref:2'3'-cyclic-nucleotide 2'-phosphodiesterase 5'-nucleotidase n=1 Tax=Simulacricoccus ruber TaxID=2303410 RepID=A0A3Q8I8M0_9BACT|nr:2'3'-cyclic-nucleotide 2'-phosphodiesterase 5'-nucleotidase [Simulacricoccus ruber]
MNTRPERLIRIPAAPLLGLAFALAAAAAPPRAAATHQLTVLHTNDLHGHLEPWTGWEGGMRGQSRGGMARLAARIDEARAAAGHGAVLLLDAGDTIGDTMLAARTEGRAVIEAMNRMGYDAMAVGNHEPDFGEAALRERMSQARFPVLAANVTRAADGALLARPYVIREVGGLRVGLLGLAYPSTPLTSARRNVDGLHFAAAASTARTFVPRMRQEGAQLVIALTHLGLGADRQLAREVEGIDVIVGGHSHNRMADALRVGGTLIVQAGAHGSDLGRLDLTVSGGRITAHRHRLIPVTGDGASRPVAAALDVLQGPLREDMAKVVARAATPIVRAQTLAGQQPGKRDQESPADSLFADAIRETTGTELAFLPGLGYGVALQPGPVTTAQLRNLIPHDTAIWTLRLPGRLVRDALEQSIENVVTKDATRKVGGMIQVSGLRFAYRPDAPRGQRVRSVTVAGAPLAAGRVYTVAVNGLLAEGGHRYTQFEQGTERREVGEQFTMVRDWMARRGVVSAPAPGRIARAGERP